MGISDIGCDEQTFVNERERVICGIVERNLVTARQLQSLRKPGFGWRGFFESEFQQSR